MRHRIAGTAAIFSFTLAVAPCWTWAEVTLLNLKTTSSATVLSGSNSLDSDSMTIDPAPRVGSFIHDWNSSGLDQFELPYQAVSHVSASWQLSPDGTQGWAIETQNVSQTGTSPSTVSTGFRLEATHATDLPVMLHRKGYIRSIFGNYNEFEDSFELGVGSVTLASGQLVAKFSGQTIVNVFSTENTLPGTNPNPWQPTHNGPAAFSASVEQAIDLHSPLMFAARPHEQVGSFFTTSVPIAEEAYGFETAIHFETDLSAGYSFAMDGSNRMRSFEIPAALPLGDDQFELHYQGTTYPITAGQEFNLTTLDASGVESFLITGINEAELTVSDSVLGYATKFMSPGIAELTAAPLEILNANFDLDFDIDGDDLATWKSGFGIGTARSQGDANGDQDVDGDDFLIWQTQYTAAVQPAQAPVPEPSTLFTGIVTFLASTLSRQSRQSTKFQ